MSKKEPLLSQPLDKNKKIGFVFSPQLGDSLISMVVVYNLRRNGYDVTVFSDHMFAMKSWFCNDKIYPYPQEDAIKSTLSNYDLLIFTYPHNIIGKANEWHPHIIVLANSPLIKAKKSIVDIQIDICREELHLTDLVRVNDLIPPKSLEYHKYKNRVIIHPTSRDKQRSWSKGKFILFAKKLKRLDYNPIFIVSPIEHQEWSLIEKEGLETLCFPSLDKVASYIYESGWFIGNDSGLGHLASNLGLNTATLFVRPGAAKQWRPSWMPGIIILPPAWLITRQLKAKFWRNFISVHKVLKACMRESWTKITSL